MKKNIVLIFSLLITGLLSAQEISPVSNPATADTPMANTQSVHQISNYNTNATFGFLSYNEVMKAMPEYIKAQDSLEKLKKYYDQEMNRSEEEFTKKFSEFIDGYKSFPENIMLKRQKELQQLMEQSISFKNEAQQLLNKSEKELMEPIYKVLNEAIKKIGIERNYSYVLNTDANAYPFINTLNGQGEDITEIVKNIVK